MLESNWRREPEAEFLGLAKICFPCNSCCRLSFIKSSFSINISPLISKNSGALVILWGKFLIVLI